ncbi:hypothetical protein FB480_1109 [Agrobacterium vitis]|nr:hypothetical protein FB480_1109 [Agrobacterium vitis]
MHLKEKEPAWGYAGSLGGGFHNKGCAVSAEPLPHIYHVKSGKAAAAVIVIYTWHNLCYDLKTRVAQNGSTQIHFYYKPRQS